MSFARLGNHIRELLWTDDAPRVLTPQLYAFCIGCGSAAISAYFTMRPWVFGGPASAPPRLNLPRGWDTVLTITCLIVFGAIGYSIGWRVSHCISRMAADHPKFASPLLYGMVLLPVACLFAPMPFFTNEHNRDTLGILLVGVGIGATILIWQCHSFRRNGWPNYVPPHACGGRKDRSVVDAETRSPTAHR